MAQKRQLALNKDAKLKVVAKKMHANTKPLQKAQQALENYTEIKTSPNYKDWGDVIQWVRPKAKVEFLLKEHLGYW